MVARKRGLIVNISHWAAQKHIGNVAYGVAKAATDKMTADMATELKRHDVAMVALYPGMVRTEKVMESAAVARPDQLRITRIRRPSRGGPCQRWEWDAPSGQVLVVADLARQYGFTDVDGASPRPLTLADV